MKQVINCKYNNEVFEGEGVIEVSPYTSNITLTVGVNGDYNCHDFIIADSGDSWMVYKVVNNTIHVTLKSNFKYVRESSLYIMHKLNNLVQTIITFRQLELDYKLTLTDVNNNVINNNHVIEFNNLLEQNDGKQETYTINYNCEKGKLLLALNSVSRTSVGRTTTPILEGIYISVKRKTDMPLQRVESGALEAES